jgi:outer membrane protein OmpA-like peptidoglycan-associated protein
MKKILLLLIICLAGSSISYAQIDFGNLEEEQIYRKDGKYNLWSIGAGFGPVIFYGDVIDYTMFPSDNLKFGPSVNIARQFGRSWSVDAQFMMADLYGKKYNRYFEGDFREASLNLNANLNQLILGGPMRDRWNIYAKLGFGINYFRSAVRVLNTIVDNNNVIIKEAGDLYTVDEIFTGGAYPTNYSDWNAGDYLVMGYKRDNPDAEEIKRKSQIVIPLGLGVKYRINKSFDLGFDLTLRNLVADNLDVDMTGADNDSYMYAAVTVNYKLGKKDKRHASWTYKDFNLSYERDRARDPLAQKLDSLKQELELLAASDTVIRDTTIIHNERIIKKESFATSVFFDYDESEITPRAHRIIANVARHMRSNTSARILVQGYCDDRGTDDYNVKLSQRRCNAVVDILVKDYNIDASRFETEPKGEKELLSDTKTLAPRGVHLVNRRVDIFQISE